MMRNSLANLSHTPPPADHARGFASGEPTSTRPPFVIPTIRLTTATPSVIGTPTESSPLAPKQGDTRKRVVPKKSKLSLLAGKSKESKDKGKTQSMTSQQNGSRSSINRSFEIYVDPTDDPDIGEIVVVRKKKSRGTLDGLRWSTLGEITNVERGYVPELSTTRKIESESPKLAATVEVKPDEKEKWWTLGRGRKNSKRLTIFKASSTPPQEVLNTDSRQRAHSLDATFVLNDTPAILRSEPEFADIAPRQRTNTDPGLFSLPKPASGPTHATERPSNGSIALRAMRSVRSIVRIGSSAQLRSAPDDDDPDAFVEKLKRKGKHKRSKSSVSKSSISKPMSIRSTSSGSSFEAGVPSPVRQCFPPSALRRMPVVAGAEGAMGTVRTVSSQMSQGSSSGSCAESKRSSGVSSSSSRTVSILNTSRTTRRTSGSSVRWNDQVETVKERKLQNIEERARGNAKGCAKGSTSGLEGRRRASLANLFQAMSDQWGGKDAQQVTAHRPAVPVEIATPERDIDTSGVLVEMPSMSESNGTPPRRPRPRPRPVSDQSPGGMRRYGVCLNNDGAMSMLETATTDLANLINRLDLQATPDASPRCKETFSAQTIRAGSADNALLQKRLESASESPSKKKGKSLFGMSSISSLRAFAQLRGKAKQAEAAVPSDTRIQPQSRLGGPIYAGPIMSLDDDAEAEVSQLPPAFRPMHKQSKSTPAAFSFDGPVFRPMVNTRSSIPDLLNTSMMSSSSQTFGTPPVRIADFNSTDISGTDNAYEDATSSPTVAARVFHSQYVEPRERASTRSRGGSMPVNPVTRRELGMRSAMASVGSLVNYTNEYEDHPAEVPRELQHVFQRRAGIQSRLNLSLDDDDTVSFRRDSYQSSLPPSPGTPPADPLPAPSPNECMRDGPIYHENQQLDADEMSDSSDGDTKKSFDFTGELYALTEAGTSDRRSFVEQLENAFKPSAGFDISSLGEKLGLGPASDRGSSMTGSSHTPTLSSRPTSETISEASVGVACQSAVVYERPTRVELLGTAFRNVVKPVTSDATLSARASKDTLKAFAAKASNGVLKMDFKFGGKSSPDKSSSKSSPEKLSPVGLSSEAKVSEPATLLQPPAEVKNKPLTLSDILPPLDHSYAPTPLPAPMVAEDSYVLKAISPDGTEQAGPEPRSRLNSEVSSRHRFAARQAALDRLTSQSHSRRDSDDVSFLGMPSFSEVRRAFEFGPNRAPFYPLANISQESSQSSRVEHPVLASPFSLASVSDYGRVINPGRKDPLQLGVPLPVVRPPSMDMSITVDDTFDFINGVPRRRVDSDASSFYFNPAKLNRNGGSIKRNNSLRQKYRDSVASVASGPPVSLYNRGFAGQPRNDASSSSGVHPYGGGNASAIRNAWARHRRDQARESFASDRSLARLGRPGIGDKMFESARELGVPLPAISASPAFSLYSEDSQNQSASSDSITKSRRSVTCDSVFDETGNRSSVSSDLFGFGNQFNYSENCGLLLPPKYRPVSMFSLGSVHSPRREDDTMISMLGGGHVRRQSIGSTVETSPCVRLRTERRIHDHIPVPARHVRFQQNVQDDQRSVEDDRRSAKSVNSVNSVNSSTDKARIIDSESIRESIRDSSGTALSEQFGGMRMQLAQQGMLSRHSLEESCLSGEGEDSLTSSYSLAVFRRPGPVSRDHSRSHRSSYTAESSGLDTPPLSASDGSSISGGSQASIDVAQLNVLLAAASDPTTGSAADARPRVRGQGHRKRLLSQTRAKRSSVYETIAEEVPGQTSPEKDKTKQSFGAVEPKIQIVHWDEAVDENGDADETGQYLRRYYALRHEANEIVNASRKEWADTPLSIFAIQTFEPPRHPDGIQDLLEHSKKTYGPLPSELRIHRRRSRTLSRPSPYPRSRKASLQNQPISNSCMANDVPVPSITVAHHDSNPVSHGRVLQELRPITNIKVNSDSSNICFKSPKLALSHLKPISPFTVDFTEQVQVLQERKKFANLNVPASARPRKMSIPRQTGSMSGRGKGVKPSADKKENAIVDIALATNASETLRIVRPRPRGRPTPNSRYPQILCV